MIKRFLYIEETVRSKIESVYQKNRVRNSHLPPKQVSKHLTGDVKSKQCSVKM